MANPTTILSRVLAEIGIINLHRSPFDTKLLCLQRFVRLFAYSSSTLVLALYLKALGFSEERIGLFMTFTAWGDVVISFGLTLVADQLGRKMILCVGSALMSVSGVVFSLSGNYWILLAAAVLGVISPSGQECGPFKAVEESTLAHLSPKEVRTDILTWYTLLGTAGASLGLLTCGWTMSRLKSLDGWSDIAAYRFIFLIYAVVGLLKLALALSLSKNIEADTEPRYKPLDQESASFLGNGSSNGDGAFLAPQRKGFLSSLLPQISKESISILVQLCLLFALDSFASGLASQAWIPYFFKTKFDISDGYLGTLFFTASIITTISVLFAASLARRIGNIKTMVFTHLPSAICLSLIPFPTTLLPSAALLLIRASTQSMDSAPRSAFLAAVVLPNERTAVMGFINVVKIFANSLGPSITGFLAMRGYFWLAFVAAGSMKATYDLGMLAVFHGHVSREDKEAGKGRNGSGATDDDGEELEDFVGEDVGTPLETDEQRRPS